MPSLTVDGRAVAIGTLWVHLQRSDSSHRFRLFVEHGYVADVFDSFRCRVSGDSWPSHIRHQIDDLGTFALDIYLKNIRKVTGERRAAHEWVVASVDDISVESAGLAISGVAVAFISRLPELVPLE
ncbi:MAG TPA: hypothetical protein VNH11_00595 [Pirellulales bacterium]|nr:hypothetical protein [Pirellulales bacterium]